ncbi:uncharacterized protein [Littorina saxatilis]|uniref:uncharacterized protein isoform X2 n=1 Tax=Littorina saxatilis TaxID=31220 RepID=UPI0038B441F8
MVSTGTQLWRIYIIHMLIVQCMLFQIKLVNLLLHHSQQSRVYNHQQDIKTVLLCLVVGLPAEQSPTEDLTIPHADKDADSELDAQFEYSDVSDDDNKVPLNVTDDDSDDTVEDVHDFHFLDDCAEDSTNVTGVLKLFKELKLKLAKLVKTHPNFNI